MVKTNFPSGPWVAADYNRATSGCSLDGCGRRRGVPSCGTDHDAPGKCRRTYNDFCHQPCAVCGMTLPPWRAPGRVMVAHHRNPATKRHSPSELSRRSNKWWLVLVEELLKCVPLCATCHAVVHDVMSDDYADGDSWEQVQRRARADISHWEKS